jgi:hypothetical protein
MGSGSSAHSRDHTAGLPSVSVNQSLHANKDRSSEDHQTLPFLETGDAQCNSAASERSRRLTRERFRRVLTIVRNETKALDAFNATAFSKRKRQLATMVATSVQNDHERAQASRQELDEDLAEGRDMLFGIIGYELSSSEGEEEEEVFDIHHAPTSDSNSDAEPGPGPRGDRGGVQGGDLDLDLDLDYEASSRRDMIQQQLEQGDERGDEDEEEEEEGEGGGYREAPGDSDEEWAPHRRGDEDKHEDEDREGGHGRAFALSITTPRTGSFHFDDDEEEEGGADREDKDIAIAESHDFDHSDSDSCSSVSSTADSDSDSSGDSLSAAAAAAAGRGGRGGEERSDTHPPRRGSIDKDTFEAKKKVLKEYKAYDQQRRSSVADRHDRQRAALQRRLERRKLEASTDSGGGDGSGSMADSR